MTYPTRCDFCSRPFTANRPGCRTCVACEVRGAPDQSKPGYDRLLAAYWRKLAAEAAAVRRGRKALQSKRLISDGPGRGGARSGSGRPQRDARRACGE